MAGPSMTFQPEEVRRSRPWEVSGKQSLRALREQNKAVRKWTARFKREFVPRFMAAYNAEARRRGLPPMDRKWLDIVPRVTGGAAGPKSFYVKHRAKLQPRMFPGDPSKAAKAYDLFLKGLDKIPYVKTGPVSGTLAHETGHAQSFWTDPLSVMRSRRRRMRGKIGPKPPVQTAVNEAVGSYRGFKIAWRAWKAWGIPRKAWTAWSGFPTYLRKMSPAEVKKVFAALKKLDSRLPGIYDMARKAVYNYADYVRPAMYNVPGKDWTPAEKAALKKWVESRGGTYRESIPATPKERLKHLRRQPYVMRGGGGGVAGMAAEDDEWTLKHQPFAGLGGSGEEEDPGWSDNWVKDLGIPGVVDEKGLMFKIQWMTRQRKVDLGPVKAERHYRLNRMDAKNIIAALLRPMYVEPHRTRSRRIYLVGKDSEGNPRGLIIVIEDKIVVITAGLHAGLKASPGSRKEAGEVIPFPSESVAPAEKRPDPARMLEPGFSHEKGSWFVVSAMGLPVAWYDRSHQAERAAAFLRRSFAEGADEGTYSPMRFAIEMAQATERVYDEFAGEHDPWDLYRFIEQWFSSPKHAKDRRAVAEQVVGIHEIPKGSVAPGLQPMSGPPEHVSEETFAKARAFGLDKQLEHPRDMADLVAEHLIDAVMSRRAEEGGAR